MGITTSRKTAAAALAAAVLIGGGIAAVAPAAAEDSAQFAATNWKKVWKNNLQQYADKRYYTKKKSDKKYATKTDLGNYYTKTQTDATYATKALTYSRLEADAKYALKTQSYTKAESDAKYAPYPTLVRGVYHMTGTSAGAGESMGADISFGVTLAAVPTAHYIPLGGTVPTGCSGTPAAPSASAGNLCIFEAYNFGSLGAGSTRGFASPTAVADVSTTMGVIVYGFTNATAGNGRASGTWALRPASLAAPGALSPTGPAGGPTLDK